MFLKGFLAIFKPRCNQINTFSTLVSYSNLMKTKSCLLEPSIVILLQVCGNAPLHTFAPAPQLQGVPRQHA